MRHYRIFPQTKRSVDSDVALYVRKAVSDVEPNKRDSLRLFKQVATEAAVEKNTGGVAVFTRPTPGCRNSFLLEWGT
jgi:hypothetical protein